MTIHDPRWDAVAREKLARVLGAPAAQTLLDRGLAELRLERLETPDDLHVFAQWLTEQEGFAAPVGGLLSVHALVHGATGTAARHRAR